MMMHKSVVLVTRDFPPYCPQVGWMIRVTALANFLVAEGFEVTVVALSRRKTYRDLVTLDSRIQVRYVIDPAYAAVHNSLQAIVQRLRRRFRKSITARFTIDDLQPMLPKYRRVLKKLIQTRNPGSIIISSPPCSLRLLSCWCKRRFSELRVIADYRDSWSLRAMYVEKISERRQARLHVLEQKTLDSNDITVFVSSGMQQQYQERFSLGESIVVQNGFIDAATVADAMDPQLEQCIASARARNKMILGYAGSGSVTGIGHKDFLQLIKLLREEPYASACQLIVVGKVKGMEELEPQDNLYHAGVLPNDQTRRLLTQVDIGLVVHSETLEAPAVMGGKLYDCIGAGTPVWFLVPENAVSIQDFLRTHGKGYLSDVFSYDAVRNTLESILLDFEQRLLVAHVLSDTERVQYSRRNQYAKLIPFLV